jgi:inorganic pyrophosphatase
MPKSTFPEQSEKFEIQAYKPPKDLKSLMKTHVAFTGSPQKHPFDSEKVILIADPFSTHTFYYEFRKDDITYIEELSNLVNPDGEAMARVRVWVKKMSIGLRSTPFLVDDTRS